MTEGEIVRGFDWSGSREVLERCSDGVMGLGRIECYFMFDFLYPMPGIGQTEECAEDLLCLP